MTSVYRQLLGDWSRPLSAVLLGLVVAIANVVFVAMSPKPPMETPQPALTPLVKETIDLTYVALYEKRNPVSYGSPKISKIKLELREKSRLANVDADVVTLEGIDNVAVDPKRFETEGRIKRWVWDVTVTHDGRKRKTTESLAILVRYEMGDPPSVFKWENLAVPFEIEMLDFPVEHYLVMTWIGVLLSYFAAEGGKVLPKMKEDPKQIWRPILWLAFSFISTPVLYMQFSQLGVLTDLVLLNLFLAVPIGAGIDLAMGKAGAARTPSVSATGGRRRK